MAIDNPPADVVEQLKTTDAVLVRPARGELQYIRHDKEAGWQCIALQWGGGRRYPAVEVHDVIEIVDEPMAQLLTADMYDALESAEDITPFADGYDHRRRNGLL